MSSTETIVDASQQIQVLDQTLTTPQKEASNIIPVPFPTASGSVENEDQGLKESQEEGGLNILDKVSKKLEMLQSTPMQISVLDEKSNEVQKSIASLKEQESFNSMRKTLRKMHQTVDYVYEEMPEREALYQSSLNRKSRCVSKSVD